MRFNNAPFVAVISRLSLSTACSFLVANYNISREHSTSHLTFANEVQQRRGPDATNIAFVEGWSFLHNLLSMTGAFTLQPFVSQDPSGTIVALFNGEVYNYRELAVELTGHPDTFASDGLIILPAYRKWGTRFVSRLHGEFSLVLLDIGAQHVVLSADVFGTKPLWWAMWRTERGEWRFLAASYESVLSRLGAPEDTRRTAPRRGRCPRGA